MTGLTWLRSMMSYAIPPLELAEAVPVGAAFSAISPVTNNILITITGMLFGKPYHQAVKMRR